MTTEIRLHNKNKLSSHNQSIHLPAARMYTKFYEKLALS